MHNNQDYSLTSFFIDQLESKQISFLMKENDIAVKCPFHEHRGRKYHLNIAKTGKKVHCWSCGWGKGGKTWNDYAEHMGLELLSVEQIDKSKFDSLGYELYSDLHSEEMQEPYTQPLELDWLRYGNGPDLPKDFLLKFHAAQYYDDKAETYRIYLPVYTDSELLGWFVMWRDKEKPFRKSINAKGPWVRNTLYPIDFISPRTHTAFLVEGQYDALRLIFGNVPALSFLGVENWNRQKVQLLRDYDFNKIYILLDADKEGYLHTPTMYNSLVDYFSVTVIELPENRDPGSLLKTELNFVKKLAIQYKKEHFIKIKNLEKKVFTVE